MRRTIIVVLGAALALAVATTAVIGASPRNFVAPLNGAEEVLPDGTIGVDTRARGAAIFQLSSDGSELSYRLIASNIENVLMAHIHCCAGPGANAGIAVWLYPDEPPPQLIPGRSDGVLATGTITAGDVIGMSLADLVDEIRAGNAYVNVHTSQVPSGEIRGQLP
jgi:hypothetical protein